MLNQLPAVYRKDTLKCICGFFKQRRRKKMRVCQNPQDQSVSGTAVESAVPFVRPQLHFHVGVLL